MLKLLSICAMFIALAMAPASAQQEAILRKVEVTGAGFDIVLAMSKPGGTTYDLAKSPEALLIHLIGGQLVLGFDAPEKMLAALSPCGHQSAPFTSRARATRRRGVRSQSS